MITQPLSIVIRTEKGRDWVAELESYRLNLQNLAPSVLTVDLIEVFFLSPHHVVSLSCVIEEYFMNDWAISFRKSRVSSVNDYLNNIRFFEAWSKGFDRDIFLKPKISTALPLWKISKERIDSYSGEVKAYFQRNHLAGKNLDVLSIALLEVFNNIFDHAGSVAEGFVMTQYYPRIAKIILSICDFGVGIPHTINQFWMKNDRLPLNDSQALRAAFMKKVSSRSSPRNRGFGLATLKDIVEANNGTLRIYSNRARLEPVLGRDIVTFQADKSFSGTLIDMEFNTKMLPLMEIESNNDFTFS